MGPEAVFCEDVVEGESEGGGGWGGRRMGLERQEEVRNMKHWGRSIATAGIGG